MNPNNWFDFRVVLRPNGYHLQRGDQHTDLWESLVVFEGCTKESEEKAMAAFFAEVQATRDLPIVIAEDAIETPVDP